MDRPEARSTGCNLLWVWGCVLAMGTLACAPVRRTGGEGGANGQGGSQNGGSGGSEPGGSGGVQPGEAGGAGTGGGNGLGGSTGTALDAAPDLSPAGCTTATLNPCTGIPKLTGTPTIDGKVDDLCNVPSFQFTAANAAKKISYNRDPNEEVTARVAWSPAGLVFFADVKDPSVESTYSVDPKQAIDRAYQGDSLEVFISSSNNVTGLTGTDSNTLHVIVPAVGPAVSVKTSNSSGSSAGTPTALAATDYHQVTTATGWAVELLLPWPGTAPSAGTTVRFDVTLNSADSTFGNVDDLRDGQMMYYVGTVTNTTCKSNDGTVPFCDDRTWCATQLQ